MAYVPFAPQLGAVFTLSNPVNGVSAVFNDTTSGNFVGTLSGIDGLESPEVRESAEDLVQADGGTHGYFWFGRRPIVITAQVTGHGTVAVREARVDRAKRASQALRADSTLSWTNIGGMQMFVPVRLNGRFMQSGGWNKEIQIPLVSEYATIQSVTLRTQTGAGGATVTCENQGSWPATPILRVTGPSASNFTITNTFPNPDTVLRTTGGLIVASGETLEIDTLNHSAYFTAGARNGQSANRFIDFGLTTWPLMPTGNNTFVLSGTGTLVVNWRDTWV